MKKITFFGYLVLLLSCTSETGQSESNILIKNNSKYKHAPYVIMVSLDGYRHDYTVKYQAKTLSQIAKEGVVAEALIPIYPTKTFPNHYTIVTGLYSENHGLVSNNIYDPKTNLHFSLGDRSQVQNGQWYQGDPLWVVAHKQKMVTASYFWVGTEAKIQGIQPDYFYMYDGRIPNSERVDQVIEWLKKPLKERPHLIMMYLSDVDSAGHDFGPDSPQVAKAVHKVDQVIKRLLVEVKKMDLPIHLVITSDHGMQKIDPDKTIYLEDHIKINKDVLIKDKGTLSLLYFKDKSKISSYYKKLTGKKGFNVYTRENVPSSFHFSQNRRIGDLVIEVLPSYYLRIKRKKKPSKMSGGTHGYDPNKSKDMHGVFYAWGPHFKKGYKVKAFENIHIYPAILKLLGLEPISKTDGKIEVLNSIFQ